MHEQAPRKRNGPERWKGPRPDTKPSLADRSRTGPKAQRARARNAFQHGSESVEQVYARESIYLYTSAETAFSALPGVQEMPGIHRVELLTPKRLLATIYCSIGSVRRVLLLVSRTPALRTPSYDPFVSFHVSRDAFEFI